MNYTINELAERFNVSKEQVRRWCRTGKLKSVKHSKKEGFIIEECDLKVFLDNYPKYRRIFELSSRLSTQEINELASLIYQLEIKKQEIKELEIRIKDLETR